MTAGRTGDTIYVLTLELEIKMDNVTKAKKKLDEWKKVPTLKHGYINDMVVTGHHVSNLTFYEINQILSASSNEILRQLCPKVRKNDNSSTFSALATWNLYKIEQKFGREAIINEEIDGLRRRGIKDDVAIMNYANRQMAAMITILTE